MPHPRRLIWFCQTEHVAKQPEQLALLRDEIGLTTIMPESPICHTSGFRASPEVAARGPFEDWRERGEAWPKVSEGIYPPVSGVIGGFDDTDLCRVIEAASAAGIEVWGHIGLWSYGGDVYPEHALRTIDGASLDTRYSRWGIGLCPSREAINQWTKDGLVDIAQRYDVDGFCVDHARYPQPASVSALAACGCASCVEEGTTLGFDVAILHQALRDTVRRVRDIKGSRLQQLARDRLSPEQLWAALEISPHVTEWFQMRSALLAKQMQHFREGVQQIDASMVFGCDIFAPSVSLFGGHDLALWETATDYITGGSSAGGVVGWATASTNAAFEWTRSLAEVTQGAEADWLELTLQVLGVDDLAIPRDIEALDQGRDLPIEELYDREIARLVADTNDRVPLYPPVSAGGDPERTRRLCRSIADHGGHGAMMTLAPDRKETLRAIQEGFGA